MKPTGPEISLVMPCFNEELIVSHTIARLTEAFARAGHRMELIAVDNGSADRTGEIIRRWAASNAGVVYHRVEVNEGYGNGILAGLPVCQAPWVGIVPADGQVDAEDVVRLYEAVAVSGGRRMAKARRRFRMDGPIRKVVSIGYNVLFRVLWPGVASIDINGLPKIVPRRVLGAMNLTSRGWFLDPEIMIKAHALGVGVLEFNVFARMRGNGVSHVRAATCWEFLRNMLAYRFSAKWKSGLRPVPSPGPEEEPAEPLAAAARSGMSL